MLREAESWTDEQMQEFQQRRLQQLLSYATTEVPFYRDWFQDHSLDPLIVSLEQMPIVNKAIMRQEGIDRFSAEHFPVKERMSSRSSGSTGEPFSFYTSKQAYSINTAAKLRTWYMAGYRLGDRYMKIANGARHGKFKKLQDKVNNCIYVPFYSMTDDMLKAILDNIERSRPTFVRSYPIPLYLLAQYRNSHSGYSFCPRHIMTTGSTLPVAYRIEIEKAFCCDIIDSYSCEGTPNTYETPAHDGYHTCNYYGIIEVLDDNNKPITNGIGRVVSTDLWNMAHPFIRYDSQDLVEVNAGRIVRIMGRECESLVVANGQRYTVHNFVGFFQEDNRPTRQSVTAYQVVVRNDNSITFRLVVNGQYTPDIEQYIIDFWQQQLGVPVNVSLVDEIPLMQNNKRLTIIKE
ncbi:MAG: phenylacetate--CoA ligase family protein [Bacteroidales bacterium]|nr:phenylacetate--CoA ligase family protein [Bacteroidales bacterium]